jgi:hypothetical protein
MRLRVWSETPERPLSTFETVATDTSAASATADRVARVGLWSRLSSSSLGMLFSVSLRESHFESFPIRP